MTRRTSARLKAERNNNTSVCQVLLRTREYRCSKHVTYTNSVNPHVCISETFTVTVSILQMRKIEPRKIKPLVQVTQPRQSGSRALALNHYEILFSVSLICFCVASGIINMS